MQRQICLDYVKISKDLVVFISVSFKIRFVSLIMIILINIGQSWPNCVTLHSSQLRLNVTQICDTKLGLSVTRPPAKQSLQKYKSLLLWILFAC